MEANAAHPPPREEARYRTLVEGSIQGILIHRAFRPLFVNQALATMFGYEHPNDVLQLESIRLLIAPEIQTPHQLRAHARMQGMPAFTQYEFQGVARDESRRWFDNIVTVVEWERTPAIQVTLVDITTRKELEAAQHRLETHLRQMHKLTTLGIFAGGLAHDFNNFLGAMMGHLEFLSLITPPGSEGRLHVHEALEAGKHAKELVQRLAAWSQHFQNIRSPLDLLPLIEKVRTLLQPAWPATVTFHQTVEQQVYPVLANVVHMQQMLMNLYTNAVEAMGPRGGELEVRLAAIEHDGRDRTIPPELALGAYVRLCVRDTGPGMAPPIRDRIFEPFFTTKSEQGGTGLGLVLVQSIVSYYGGTITVESTPKQGTAFTLYLPHASGSPETSAAPGSALAGNAVSAPPGMASGPHPFHCPSTPPILTSMSASKSDPNHHPLC